MHGGWCWDRVAAPAEPAGQPIEVAGRLPVSPEK
jgi:hypothetical protein